MTAQSAPYQDYAAFDDGVCVAIHAKDDTEFGKRAAAETLREWARKGYEVRTMDRGDACDALLAGMKGLKA